MFWSRLSNHPWVQWFWDKGVLPAFFVLMIIGVFAKQTWLFVIVLILLSASCFRDAKLCQAGSPKAIRRVMNGSRFLSKIYVLMRNHGNMEEACQALIEDSRLRRYLVIELYIWAVGGIIVVFFILGSLMGFYP